MTALDALDRAFASEEPFPVGGCTYCYGEEGLAELSRPLHLIPDDMVSAAAGEVPSHWDDFPRLYRRLVPRIIRPLVAGRFHVSEELIASRLIEAGWSTWDAPLADALRNVWTAWWQATLHTHPSPVAIRDTLGLITVATDNLRPWLDMWTATRTPAADAHLADLIVDVLFEWNGSSPMCATVSATPPGSDCVPGIGCTAPQLPAVARALPCPSVRTSLRVSLTGCPKSWAEK